MSPYLFAISHTHKANSGVLAWILIIAGLLAVYGPSYWDAWHGIWNDEEFSHIPLVFLVVCWLTWQKWTLIDTAKVQPQSVLGWTVLSCGLALFLVGRVMTISSLEFSSQPLVITGILLLLRGAAALKLAWFPVFFLVFMVPLPATVIDAVTGPLKGWVSALVVDLLYTIGYPIARSGVVISIGSYQLLVADACSGLNSILSLSALGTLYLHLSGSRSSWRVVAMVASILPIAFAANVVRVTALVLITYHLGDEAGQGFLHGAAGIILMLVALVLFVGIDLALTAAGRIVGQRFARAHDA